MKTKIFFAFVLIIFISLLINFVFEKLILHDFDNYINSVKADQFKWIAVSIEDSYQNGAWNKKALSESVHWAVMLGLHLNVLDPEGQEIMSSEDVIESLSHTMHQRMEELFHIDKIKNRFNDYPVYVENKKIGAIRYYYFDKKELKQQESIFKKRTANFLYITLLISGAGLMLLAVFITQFLSKPLIRLKDAAERIAKRDFTARTASISDDEIGKLSRTFNTMAESLEKEESLRKHLMSNIAHELRTPLTIVKTQAEAISDGIIDEKKGLENIKNEIEKVINLVKGIEDVTAAEAGFFAKAKETELNLKEFLGGLIDEVLVSFKKKGLYIKLAKQQDLVIVVDDEKLEKTVRNLLSNAYKFTEKGGVVIDYGAEKNNFFIEIKDTGSGIPESELPHIFDRFYRAGETQTAGLGLGLSIVKELVEVMLGKIEVKSKAGEGTSFIIYLPMDYNRTY